jgi:limonene 1,2-monooxygenase
MPRLNFGAFLAPHHPIGEHPMLQFRRDLDLVQHRTRWGTRSSGAESTIPAAGR